MNWLWNLCMCCMEEFMTKEDFASFCNPCTEGTCGESHE